MYRSTLKVNGCRLIDKVALWACLCRVQICNRHCRIINEIYVTTLSVCRSQLQVCDNWGSFILLLLSREELWLRGPREKATKDMLAYMTLSKYMQHSCYCQAGQNNRTDNCVGSVCQIYGPWGYRYIYLHIRCLRHQQVSRSCFVWSDSPESVSRVCDWSNLCDLNPGSESELTGKQNPGFWPWIYCQDLDHAYIFGIWIIFSTS